MTVILAFFAVLLLSPLQRIGSTPYKCDVPDDWLMVAGNKSSKSFMPGTKWPQGVVKYELYSSLTYDDRSIVQKAFDDYHQKTCVRFVARSLGEAAYVSIESDPSVCGLGHYCRSGGYQFAKFGGGCRTVNIMIHELGHTLCMGNEMSRPDRDDYVHFDGCSENEIPGKDTNANTMDSMYDYLSQMHYACPSHWCGGGKPIMNDVTQCGLDRINNDGLSVLDADKLNAFYDCSGCYSHRFKNFQKLSSEDIKALVPGGNDLNVPGTTYICRAYHKGSVTPGAFILQTRICYVAHGEREHAYTKGDVLTNPKNVKMRWVRSSGTIPSNAVPVGQMHNGETMYAGRCNITQYGKEGVIVGKIHGSHRTNNAFVSWDGWEIVCTTFDILVCN